MSGAAKRKAFQRFVLLSEDAYRGALRCLEKDALARTMEHSVWYNRSGGTLKRVDNGANAPLSPPPTRSSQPTPTPPLTPTPTRSAHAPAPPTQPRQPTPPAMVHYGTPPGRRVVTRSRAAAEVAAPARPGRPKQTQKGSGGVRRRRSHAAAFLYRPKILRVYE
jgi:hypothetical protein